MSESLTADQPVDLITHVDQIELDSNRAVMAGLIINELVTNAFKYAFPDGRSGTIIVRVEAHEDIVLTVEDDGVGCDPQDQSGTGMRLVRALAAQMRGDAVWTCASGTKVTVSMPVAS